MGIIVENPGSVADKREGAYFDVLGATDDAIIADVDVVPDQNARIAPIFASHDSSTNKIIADDRSLPGAGVVEPCVYPYSASRTDDGGRTERSGSPSHLRLFHDAENKSSSKIQGAPESAGKPGPVDPVQVPTRECVRMFEADFPFLIQPHRGTFPPDE
jgi:hypothetical protein